MVRLVLCSDHIKKNCSLKDAIDYTSSVGLKLEVHGRHFNGLFKLKDLGPIISIHPFWRDYSLCTPDEGYFSRSIDYLKQLLDFIIRNKLEYIIIHPEGYPVHVDKDDRIETIIEAFKKLSSYLKKSPSSKILVENMPPASIYSPSELPEYYVGEKLEDLIPILEINNNIEFIFDLGHFICSHKVYGKEEIQTLENICNKLTYVHVHDNDGTKNNHEPLHTSFAIKMIETIESWTKPKYSFELRPNFEGLKRSISIVKEIMNNT